MNRSFDRKQTDNTSLRDKVWFRQMYATEKPRVLDCFAGNSKTWSHIDCGFYTGIELDNGKGHRKGIINADNRKVLPTIDLSRYDTIDLDSYGIPATQVKMVFDNPTLQDGTTVFYTCIHNKISAMPNVLKELAGISGMYEEAPTLFNWYDGILFFDLLAHYGVQSVTEYTTEQGSYVKHYGKFKVIK